LMAWLKSMNRTSKPVVGYTDLLGRSIAELREARGLSQGALAFAAGLSQSSLSRLEVGESAMSVAQLQKFDRILGHLPAPRSWSEQSSWRGS
jgi:transcriptional regulator with XRE-family HTH domain